MKQKWHIYFSAMILLYCTYYYVTFSTDLFQDIRTPNRAEENFIRVPVLVLGLALSVMAAFASYRQIKHRRFWFVFIPCFGVILLKLLEMTTILYITREYADQLGFNLEPSFIIKYIIIIVVMIFPIVSNLKKRPEEKRGITNTFT